MNMNKIFHRTLAGMLFLGISGLFFQSCGDDGDGNDNPTPAPTQNSLALLEANTNYSTLVSAIRKAGLESLLTGSEPYTLFAPDNQMFRDAGFATVDNATPAELKAILEYHLLKGKVLAADMPSNGYIASENKSGPASQPLSIHVAKNGALVNVNGTFPVNTTSNSTTGVIHFIGGGVMLPPTVYMLMNYNPDLKEFHSASGVVTNQKSSKKFSLEWNDKGALLTLFAPNNAAVQAYVAAKNTTLPRMNPIETSKMMNNHVITGSALSSSAIQPGVVKTDGYDMNVTGSSGNLTINGNTKITVSNVYGTNGVLHVLDKLITE